MEKQLFYSNALLPHSNDILASTLSGREAKSTTENEVKIKKLVLGQVFLIICGTLG